MKKKFILVNPCMWFVILLLGICLLNVSVSEAQLLQWNTFGNLGTETTEPSVANDVNIAGSVNLTLGPGITAATNGNRFGGSNWFDTGNTVAGNTLSEAVAGNNYIQFVVTPNGGFSFTATSLVFTWDRSGTGPSSVTLRSSADGYTADLGSVTGMISGGAATTTPRTITISSLSNINSATTFRLYGYGATGTAGTGGFDNSSSVVDVQLNGSTSAIVAASLFPGSMSGSYGNVCINTTAGPLNFSLTGVNLDGSAVTVGPLAGYTFSESAGGPFTASVSPPYTAPSLSTTIFVDFTPTLIQSYDGTIPVTGGSAPNTGTSVVGSGINTLAVTSSGAASAIGSSTATVAGTITSLGCGTLSSYGIEYSITGGFIDGSGTPIASGNLAGINFTSTLSGLSFSTVYYYHSYVITSSGTVYGAEGTFTTTLDAPVANPATNIANHSFDANWDPVAGATGYRLDVATTSTFYVASATPVVEWNFPNNPDNNVADGGISLNLSKTLNLFGNVTAVTYVPTASGTTSAATTTSGGWASGSGADYWETSMVTFGYYNLEVSSAQRSSNTGPKDFKLQYKLGSGGTYTDVAGGTVIVGNNWTSGVLTSISLPAVCENKPSVFLRWIMTSNTAVNLSPVQTGGTSAIDDISIMGHVGSFVSGYNNLATASSPQPVSGLNANATYYYRLRATASSITSNNSNVITVTTTCTAAAISACPLDIDQCDNDIATWTDPTATGDPAATVVCSPLSGSSFPPGTSSVMCTATNDCGAPSICTFNVTINESPVIGTCPGDITSCNPIVTFTDPAATGTPTPAVVCSPPSGSSFLTGTTIVNCDATNSCGISSCSFNVTINASSTDPASATSNAPYGQICYGGSVSLSVTGGTFGLGAGYVWYEGGCGTGGSIGSGPTINVTPITTGIHTYYARIEGTCNNTNCVSVSVSVISSPPSGTIHYTASIADGCVSAPAAVFSVNNIPNCTFYRWTSTASGVRFNGNPSPFETTTPTVNVSFVSLPAAGTSGWSICVFGGNACNNTNTICTWVRATVSMPGTIAGSNIGCPSATLVPYSSGTVGGAVSYQWSSTGGIVVNGNGSQSITVDFPAGFVSGTLSVHGQTACGYNGPDRSISINRAPAIPGTISGSGYPCPNSLFNAYSVSAVPGAANYTWTTTVPGAIVSGTTNSCNIQFPAAIPAGSSVTVTANSICPFSSAVRSKGIASGIPNTPSSISGPSSGQCGQTGVSYSISPVLLATGYSWSTSCGAINGPTNLSGVSVDWPSSFTNCTLLVSATNGCGTGGARSLVVLGAPSTPAVIGGNIAPCANGVETYTTAGSTGATSYTWTLPAGASIIGPANGATILMQWGSTSGNISVYASNACGNSGVRSLSATISCRMSQLNSSNATFISEVYPNPATEKATLKFISANAAKYHLEITNVLGQRSLSTDGFSAEGINVVELDFRSFTKGVYLINLVIGDDSEQIRIVVQ
ncbi:MAG: T9SS type A sorting domain-containing protein [Bacteroidota bacterium]